jgi:beta-mannosidase
MVKERIKLDNWFFTQIEMTEIEGMHHKIRGKSSIDLLQIELKPFITPGTLQSNLAKILDLDPYYEENMREFDSYENMALVLFSEFNLDEVNEKLQINFEYIDTISEIYIDGVSVEKTSNAFIQQTIKIPPTHVSIGKNLITIFLFPAMAYINNEADLPEIRDRVFVRKPAYNYGWDFAPRVILTGIGKSIIEARNALTLGDIFVYTESINLNKAIIKVEWKNKTSYADNFSFQIVIMDEKNDEIYNNQFSQFLEIGEHIHDQNIDIQNPKLWWPNGYGKQPLYRIEVREKSSGTTMHSLFGIRKIELLLQEEDEHRFIFEINGVKIWAKGGNWVPTDALTNFSTNEKYEKLLLLAKNANFNMIRVWGGGVVEKKTFYELCDELGILIWHDFQFACSMYPEDEGYLKNVEKEISGILTRLRNHPSIALWCGNNENEWIDFQHYTESYREERKFGEKLHQLKKNLCQKLDPSRPYWRSSPWSPTSESSFSYDPNSQDEGNCHDWFVWHGVGQPDLQPPEFENYASNHARFISEFGIQSFPVKSTIDRIFSKTIQESPNVVWEFHNLSLSNIKVNMKKFGEPKNIEEWILYTQTAQAFGMKFAIETWRSRKFKTAGALFWQYNEPWPTICWSVIDYYNNPKIAYYFIKRAFQPVITIYEKETNSVIIINDFTRTIECKLVLRKYSNYSSSELLSMKEYDLKIDSNGKITITDEITPLLKEEYLWIQLIYEKASFDSITFVSDPSEIKFPDPEILITFDKQKSLLTLLTYHDLAFLVELPNELEPEDNFFHLIPSFQRDIHINHLPEDKYIEIRIWSHKKKNIKIYETIPG